METPQAVLDVLEKLGGSEKEAVESYITSLKDLIKAKDSELKKLKKGEEDISPDSDDSDEDMDEEDEVSDEAPFPPLYEEGSGEDFDKAGDAKTKAADFKSAGNWEAALEQYNEAVLAAPPSALLYANRANALLKLGRPRAAERDCDLALEENPDSAKALRMRGKARKDLGKYELALKDLSASQTIDFDEGTVEDLKFLTEKHLEQEKLTASKRVQNEERLRKRAEEIKKAQEEAKREATAESSSGGMPGGMGGMPGMPGGMGGMPGMPGGGGMPPGMADIMSDPELMAAFQNPKVQAALPSLMQGDQSKIMELMSDPEVGPVIEKLMGKVGGMGGGGGGMPGGMGGMPGGFPGASGAGAAGGGDDDSSCGDMPDLEEM